MSKYATDVIKEWPWGFDIEWLNDRGMVMLDGNQVAEIRPQVDSNSICTALEVAIYSLNGVPRSTRFKFADYLCEVPRVDKRSSSEWNGGYHLWRCHSSECDWYIKIPANVGPLLLGIERWLDLQPPHAGR